MLFTVVTTYFEQDISKHFMDAKSVFSVIAYFDTSLCTILFREKHI